MRKISGILLSLMMLVSIGLSVAYAAETVTSTGEDYWLADTPTKYGFKGLYTLFSPDTAQQGKFGIGVYWDMTRFSLPGDPRYPQVNDFSAVGYYGITDKLEVGVAVPFRSLSLPKASSNGRLATDDALKEVSNSGIGNVSVGVRYNLVRPPENSGGLGLTPYVQAFLPTADAEKGLGADNTRIHFGVSAGTVPKDAGDLRLYGQVTYQFATKYDQDRRDFTETTPFIPSSQPRFERFGTNPLFQQYGNTLFYGAGLAFPFSAEDTVELFGELQAFHSFEKKSYIPMYEDGKELWDVQDGGLGVVGAKIGFGNGLALTAGWGGKVFGKEPTYEAPMWKVFAGLTYNKPRKITIITELPPSTQPEGPGQVGVPNPPSKVGIGPGVIFDCNQALAMVQFEFDRSTLTPESIEVLKQIGKYMRLCTETTLEVQGHTDWVGTENYNMGLGNRRARAVVYYLVYDEGIDPARIVKPEKLQKGIIAGETYGESKPIASNDTDAGRAQNRRVQFAKLTEDTRVLTGK